MSGFPAQWLALREPLDARSRASTLIASLVESHGAGQPRESPLEVIDLGAGTGANLRYAAPRLGGSQHWLLVERDPVLLAAIPAQMPAASGCDCRVETLELDLATQLEQLPLAPASLLTASALLDLASEEWLGRLLRRAAGASATVWFALTYDGRMQFEPAEPEDHEVRELFNRHQRGDKGFGPALGPAAAPTAARLLAQHGYHIESAPSDWHIRSEQSALQQSLLEGWFSAACEIAPDRAGVLRGWLARRLAHLRSARSKLEVGHIDMIGRPHANGA